MMNSKLTRRGFLGATAAMGAALTTMGAGALKAAPTDKTFKNELHKAFICEKPTEENVKAHAEAGFEGFEVTSWGMSDDEIKASKKLADDYGLRVHSVMRGGWDMPFNEGDEAQLEASKESVRKALRAASLSFSPDENTLLSYLKEVSVTAPEDARFVPKKIFFS